MHPPKSPNRRDRPTLPLQSVTAPKERPRTVTIGKLSGNVLPNIFRYYVDGSPQSWPRLVHVCRRWRRVGFGCFRLYFTYGASVLKTLNCWPALPIVVQYGGSPALHPPSPEDEDNITAILKQSDRVSSISLTVTSSLLEKLPAIERPFSELEDLVLLSRDSVPLTLPSAFGLATRLRSLHLNGIAFFALPQLLYSSRKLVDLRLHEVLNPWLFSPEALTDALSGMAQLQSLSLHLPSTANHTVVPQPSGKHIVLPALSRLDFRGSAGYLEGLVPRIDAPSLGDIEVTFFDNSTSDFSKLIEFIGRIEMHKSHRRAYIISSEGTISISLVQPGAPTCLKLQLICEPLSVQLSSMAQICIHFSAFLFDVEDLRISATQPPIGMGSIYSEQWLKPIKPFTGVKWLHIAGNLSTNVVRALIRQVRDRETVLPALQKLYIGQPGPCHAPLREAVVSLMTSHRLSGHRISVEYERYERLRHIRVLHGTVEPFSHQMTIEMLPDDILLNIFRHYLHATLRFWPTLARVCQRWQQIVITSPLGLDLRLYCTPGTPVLRALDCWPALPIVVLYGGIPNLDPPAPEDDDNIIAALKQSGRVSSIGLTVTSSLLDKLSTISEPFSELEELTLLSRDNMDLTLPSTFRWGPRLRTLHSTGIAFPSFPQLLLPSNEVVDLQLHEIPSAGYFSPEAFANALSGMTQLQTLSLHLLSSPPRRNYLGLPPQAGERAVLPALTCLKYRGISKYLDSFVARIDAPRLEDIGITFFGQPTMDASQLGRFIERIEMQTSLSQAVVRTSAYAISISFTNSSASTALQLQISSKQLDWQLSSMAQVCDQFSPFLSRVEVLGIDTTQSSNGQDDVGGELWLELIRSFGGARGLWLDGELTTDVLCTLGLADGGHPTVLPALRQIDIEKPMAVNEPSWDPIQSFITSRWLSGRPVRVYAQKLSCHFCHTNFTEQQELKSHLGDKHAY